MNTFINKYPVFEAEQVLSHKELNNIVSYLENQDRATRVTIFGIGIIDGLSIKKNNDNHITITCGNAITSLGYLIQWNSKTFTHYQTKPIAESFYAANYSDEPFLEDDLKQAKIYETWKNSYQLTNDTSGNSKPLTETIVNNSVIILVLEAQLIDQKNCITTNCDDKGKRLEFIVTPRLIAENISESNLLVEVNAIEAIAPLAKKRFNIPHKSIEDAEDIFNAFKHFYDTKYIAYIQDAINNLFNQLRHNFEGDEVNVISNGLLQLKNKYTAIINSSIFETQYQLCADWISDIIEAYNEILAIPYLQNYYKCNLITHFPFHIVVGSTNETLNKYRTPFYKKSSNSNSIKQNIHNLIMYFNRLNLLINNFNPNINGIKVTPSLIGQYHLSAKSIPAYYHDILNIKNCWQLTEENKILKAEPLSYHSNLTDYSNSSQVKNPLEYGLDKYNFFRIEGIIGQPYKKAIQDLSLIKNAYHLPFEVVAINAANSDGKEISIEHFEGRWDDLEVDYDIARKRVFNIAEFVIKWIQKNKSTFSENGILLSEQQIIQLEEMLDEMNSLLTDDLLEFLGNYDDFSDVFLSMNELFLFHKTCIQKISKAFNIVAEDLVDRMDDINELFLENPFDILYEAAIERWKQIYKQYFFKNFYEKNPGIDHQSGVTTGGTYVLVYVDNSIFKKKIRIGKINIENLIKKLDVYKEQFNFNDEEKLSIKKNLQYSKFKLKTKPKPLDTIKDCAEQTDKIKEELVGHIKASIKDNFNLSIQDYIMDKINTAIKFPIGIKPTNISYENLVIADFYLPYICHNTGPTIALNIPDKQPVQIAIAQTNFCANDNASYLINTQNNTSGKFVGNTSDAISLINEQWLFNPSKVNNTNSAPFVIQYQTEEGLSNSINITIVQPTQLYWTVSLIKGNSYEFKNNGDQSLNYECNFGNGKGFTKIDEKGFTNSLTLPTDNSPLEIIFRVANSICKESQSVFISTGDFNNNDFNNFDFNTPKK